MRNHIGKNFRFRQLSLLLAIASGVVHHFVHICLCLRHLRHNRHSLRGRAYSGRLLDTMNPQETWTILFAFGGGYCGKADLVNGKGANKD